MSLINLRHTTKTTRVLPRHRREKRTPTNAHAALDDPYLAFVRWRAAGRPTFDHPAYGIVAQPAATRVGSRS